ncbi:scavenger receptor class B member 1-like [Sitophilus oryzae]|uniref:Scavenger receptor class B member 1-like n=1 Tax=Sitophilus oryzae TaxID=7048 RepID=A0A6J2YJV3_SITOR|nr:scavenger receptor class B member 1-like [Sitophilus oryzae]
MKLKRAISAIPILSSRRISKPGSGGQERTDDILISLRRVSETLGVKQAKELYLRKARRTSRWKISCLLVFGIITLLSGMITLIFTPFQILLSIRLEMTPGLPPFDWWFTPPDEVLVRVHIFNVTNSERFLNGTDSKLNIQEVGPIVYREKLIHSNVIFNKNGTLTYTANRTAAYEPELNTINLNETLIVPNLAVLLIPAYFHDATMFFKFAINVLMRTYSAQPFVKTTIHDFLWNMTDPILEAAEKIAPSLVPTKNTGIMQIIYRDFKDNVTVFFGNKHGNSKFFTVDTYDGSEYLPHFSDSKCRLKFRNSSEGLSYPQMITKDTNLTYWRKTVCKLADIRYSNENSKYGIKAYNFKFVDWAYSRVEFEDNKDCYKGTPPLPNGLADVSSCYWGFPLVMSFPHFLYGDDVIRTYVDGMNPNEEAHGSFVLIEPKTGIPLEGKARSQINLKMNNMRGFTSSIEKFSNTVVPLVWVEYHQVGIPWYIQTLIYLVAVIVPVGQLPFSIFCAILGCVLVYLGIIGLGRCKRRQFEEEEILRFEVEAFLRK